MRHTLTASIARRFTPSSQPFTAGLGTSRPILLPRSSCPPITTKPREFSTTSSRWSSQVATTSATTLTQATDGFSFLQPCVPVLSSISETLNCPHVVSIVLLAFAVRTAFTLPTALWQRRRTQRMTELVVPEWNDYKRIAPEIVRARCRRSAMSFEEYKVELEKDLKSQINSLLSKHSCTTLPTFLTPLAVHLPIFFLMSALIRQACIDPSSPFSHELLLWWSPSPELAAQFKVSASILADRGLEPDFIAKLQGTQGGPTLVDRDTTMIGPIGLGMLTMTNVELTSWSRKAIAAASAQGKPDAVPKDGEPEGESRRGRIITNALRMLAIGFIPIASQAPGALVIYWLSSGAYTLLQNTIFAILDRRRESRKVSLRKKTA